MWSVSNPMRGRPAATRSASSAHVPTCVATPPKVFFISSTSARGTNANGPPISFGSPGARRTAYSLLASRTSTRNINFIFVKYSIN
ncbi:unannotated protein [freshwater metagenome]|uniref:Unannotated protein n=1 Tax=freshwater metagenome TaxID=449393 RepID=A0A6J6KFT0_9ZZZZ